MNALEYQHYLAQRSADAPAGSLRRSLYSHEGIDATDTAISSGLRAWAIERTTRHATSSSRQTTIVFGRNRSDAKRRASAPARLGEEATSDLTIVAEITSGWDDSIVWPL